MRSDIDSPSGAPALLILAAGMGSRYGGLKQMDPVGPSGETLLDYSVYDAVRAGFDRVAFVVRRDFEREFREQIVSRYAGVVPVDLAFQEVTDLPSGWEAAAAARTKPWGTGHAIWAARTVVNQPFLAINADDFYGRSAFGSVAGFFSQSPPSAAPLRMGMVAYAIRNTLSEHGSVARGVCKVGADHILQSVEEHTEIAETSEGLRGLDSQGHLQTLSGREAVSMNFWAFPPEIFPHLEMLFREFLEAGGAQNPKAEFYIPSAVNALIGAKLGVVTAMSSPDRWLGITYRDDRARVAEELSRLTASGIYPAPLWPKH